jgi:hypothetical protein
MSLIQSNPACNGHSKPTRNADLRHAQSIGHQRARQNEITPHYNAQCIHRIIQKRIAEGQPIEDLSQYGLDDATWSELVYLLSPEELEAVNAASGPSEQGSAEHAGDYEPAPAPPEPLSRSCFRSAVADVASRAKATLPQAVNGRLEKAVQLVLAGDVELMPDGSTRVGSQSDAAKLYHMVDGVCDCRDSQRPDIDGWCKHRIAAAIWKHAVPLAQAKLEAQHEPAPRAPQPSLPEAPASANCYVEIHGRKVQVTLRDYDEGRLLERLDALLQRFPQADSAHSEPQAEAEQAESACPTHGTGRMRPSRYGGTYCAARLTNGTYCPFKSKRGAK